MSSVLRHWSALALVTVAVIATIRIASPPAATPRKVTLRAAEVVARYGALPLAFETNRGQTDASVKFVARGAGYGVFLSASEVVLALRPASRQAGRTSDANEARSTPAIVSMALVGANHDPVVEALDRQSGRSHYLLGNDPTRWHRNVDRYARVKFHQVYPGVDVVYYGNQRQLEYDFVIAPGVDPGQIRLALSGVRDARLDAHGNLVLKTGHGDLLQHKPIAYQAIGGARRWVDGRYALLDHRRVGFEVGPYDARLPLVIDPVLAYSTYIGGTALDEGHDIAVDGAGNAYVTGTTASVDFPTAAAGQGSNAGGSDVFITKFNASGRSLVYSTYLGGSAEDVSLGIAVDVAGNAYVTGHTQSNNFPTTAALQPVYAGGGDDAFVAKLSASGSTLTYSTYLGGTGIDAASGIAVDRAGNAYITGMTQSVNFPTVVPRQAFNSGGGDAFVSKLNPAGSTLAYSTYLGGTAEDDGEGIAVDGTGNASVTGITRSANFPTATPLQATKSDGSDAYVAKLDRAGSAWIYSTYLGGNGDDLATGIAVDPAGNAFITGHTTSTDFPVAAAWQPAFAGGIHDAFVSKLSATGRALAYSTYLGGSGIDHASAIAVDHGGNAVITGQTTSTDFPIVAPLQTTSDQTYGNAYVTKLNAAGSGLVFSTYLGGSVPDNGSGIALDPGGNAYVAGTTSSFDFPVAHAWQAANAGLSDGFVAKIVLAAALRNDFNGDRKDDILWRNHATGANVIWKSAVSSTRQAVAAVGNLDWRVVGTDDFNGDGRADVLWRNTSTGANTIWQSANAATPQAVTGVSNLAWQVAGLGDFNGDGQGDILWRNKATGANVIWKSASAGTPQAVIGVTDLAWQVDGVGDFNADGRDDIVWRNHSTGANVIWKSASAATPQAVTGVTDTAWHVVGVGDFNADGQDDILWRNTSTGANVVWMSARSVTPLAVTGVTNIDWHVVGAGDYNGDNVADILWRNLRTGANVIWQSARSTTQQAVTRVSDLAWVVER